MEKLIKRAENLLSFLPEKEVYKEMTSNGEDEEGVYLAIHAAKILLNDKE